MQKRIMLIAISGFAMSAQPALACRCSEPSLNAAYKSSDAVAEVRIASVSAPSSDGTIFARGDVLKAWKYPLPSNIQIVTGEDCAYPLKEQGTYVLFLSKGNDAWGTYRCRGNSSLTEARDTLRWLDRYGVSRNRR